MTIVHHTSQNRKSAFTGIATRVVVNNRKHLDSIEAWQSAFLRDCKTRGLSPHTLEFYQAQLEAFRAFCKVRKVNEIPQITADLLRDYLDNLKETGHNDGGRHAKFRALRAFLLWWEREAEPDNWKTPLRNIKPPKQQTDPIPGVPIDDVKAMLATCGIDYFGIRDKAILLCLLDSGARASEFCALDYDDVDTTGGAVTIRKGKGGKSRTVFLGKKARRALRAYLKLRSDGSPALWVTKEGERLKVVSLQDVLKRRARQAAVSGGSPHDYRRAFAVNMLRNGCDLVSLSRLMGHSDLSTLNRYLALVQDDLRDIHEQNSPADRWL